MRRSRKRFGKYFVSCYILQVHIPYVVQPLLAVVKAVCCAALASSVMASRYLVCGIMWRLWRRCLCPVGHIRYVAPVEQCCQCLVGHIRHVACGAVLPMPSGAVLQMYISMSQYAVRPLLAAPWPTGYVAPVEQCCLCPVGHIRYVACGAVLPMPSGAVLHIYIHSMSQYAGRLLLVALWPTGYVAPVEQCCLCPVGHIKYVACGAVLPMPSGASLQMHILHVIVNVTVCRAALACSVIANSGACMQEL